MSKLEATVKNGTSRVGQGIDESKIKMKTTEEQGKIKLNNEKIGALYYKSLSDSTIDFKAQAKTFCDAIDASNSIIEENNKKLAEVKEKRETERLNNKMADDDTEE